MNLPSSADRCSEQQATFGTRCGQCLSSCTVASLKQRMARRQRKKAGKPAKRPLPVQPLAPPAATGGYRRIPRFANCDNAVATVSRSLLRAAVSSVNISISHPGALQASGTAATPGKASRRAQSTASARWWRPCRRAGRRPALRRAVRGQKQPPQDW